MSIDAIEPKFNVADRVRVKQMFSPGHIRTPWYVRGQTGTVERLCGVFGNPEELAYARAPARHASRCLAYGLRYVIYGPITPARCTTVSKSKSISTGLSPFRRRKSHEQLQAIRFGKFA